MTSKSSKKTAANEELIRKRKIWVHREIHQKNTEKICNIIIFMNTDKKEWFLWFYPGQATGV